MQTSTGQTSIQSESNQLPKSNRAAYLEGLRDGLALIGTLNLLYALLRCLDWL